MCRLYVFPHINAEQHNSYPACSTRAEQVSAMQETNLPSSPSIPSVPAAVHRFRRNRPWRRRGVAILGAAAVAMGFLVVSPTAASAQPSGLHLTSFTVTSKPAPAGSGISYATFHVGILVNAQPWEGSSGVVSFICDGSILATKSVAFAGGATEVTSNPTPVPGEIINAKPLGLVTPRIPRATQLPHTGPWSLLS